MKKCIVICCMLFPNLLFQLASCNRGTGSNSEAIEEGAELVKQNCASCHVLPTPNLLNKETWLQYVLPKMGNLLGFKSLGSGGRYYAENEAKLTIDEWNKIVLYYYTQSPESLPPSKSKPHISIGLPQFSVEFSSFSIQKPATTVVQLKDSKNLFFGDGSTGNVYSLLNGLVLDSAFVGKGPSHVKLTDSGYFALSMGLLHPSDAKMGKLVWVGKSEKEPKVIIDSLQRPVHASYADINNDGLEDIVMSEFGNNSGALSWFEKKPTREHIKHVLRPLPGAIQTAIFDFDKDGKPDILSLMAQGDEGFFIYYNQGNGIFKEERVLQFFPSFGSNSFQLVDFNNDGYVDIVATNGDNGDYPPVLKDYHGLRIYLNDRHNYFAEKLFLPVNGIGKAIAVDFDNDGDLDVASIAYFPDFESTPEEGFIYWENMGQSFKPLSFKEVSSGRWLTMEAADYDGDGDVDIVLGNAVFQLGNVPQKQRTAWDHFAPSVLILINNLH